MKVQPVNQLNNCDVIVLYKITWKGILMLLRPPTKEYSKILGENHKDKQK